jgi:hypothetical protein
VFNELLGVRVFLNECLASHTNPEFHLPVGSGPRTPTTPVYFSMQQKSKAGAAGKAHTNPEFHLPVGSGPRTSTTPVYFSMQQKSKARATGKAKVDCVRPMFLPALDAEGVMALLRSEGQTEAQEIVGARAGHLTWATPLFLRATNAVGDPGSVAGLECFLCAFVLTMVIEHQVTLAGRESVAPLTFPAPLRWLRANLEVWMRPLRERWRSSRALFFFVAF